jgi:hypothetical protein
MMSELAFNANGDSFEVPASVTAWRVRRMKPRGAPELVYGVDGRPLTVSIEATIDDLRDAVGASGKYRLDPISDEGKCVDAVPPAYVQVAPLPRNAEPVVASSVAPSDDTLREAMRLNTELARSIVDRFPEMLHAAAELLRAADGAGLPMRERASAVEEDDGDDEDIAPSSGLDLSALVAQLAPMIVGAIASGKAKLPSIAEMLDWRKAAASAKPATTEPTPPVTTPSPDAMARVSEVLAALTPEERTLAMAMAKELSPEERTAWFAELAPLPNTEAVARVRTLLGTTKREVAP